MKLDLNIIKFYFVCKQSIYISNFVEVETIDSKTIQNDRGSKNERNYRNSKDLLLMLDSNIEFFSGNKFAKRIFQTRNDDMRIYLQAT